MLLLGVTKSPGFIRSESEHRCGSCGKQIEKSEVVFKGEKLHEECFKCFVCNDTLGDSFYEKNDRPYCGCLEKKNRDKGECVADSKSTSESATNNSIGNDELHDDTTNLCFTCSKSLVDTQRISALGKKFHLTCFVCYSCKTPLDSDFFDKNSLPHCDKCA